MARFAVSHLDEIEELPGDARSFRGIRHHFGITTFGVNATTAVTEGELLIKEHEHDASDPEASEELYLVMNGHATFELDGEAHDAPAGTFVHVQPGVTRNAVARVAGTTVLAIGAGPQGQAYQPDGWELFSPLFSLFETGDYEKGADAAEQLIADNPPFPGLYYNTACFQALAGREDAAMRSLERAVTLRPALAELAKDDEDFAGLRARPDWSRVAGQ